MFEADSGGGSGDLFTPPTGDPGTIRADADKLKGHGRKFGDIGYAARRSGNGLTSDWTGQAADAFSGFAGDVAAVASATEDPVETMARGAHDYADALEAIQKALPEAKARNDQANAKAEHIADSVNSNPDRTDAQVHDAQQRIDAAQADAKDAEDDAQRAWDRYNSESAAAAAKISGGGQTLASDDRIASIGEVIKESGDGEEEGNWLTRFFEKNEKIFEKNEWVHVGATFSGIDYFTGRFGDYFGDKFEKLSKVSEGLEKELDGWKSEIQAITSKIGPGGPTEEQESALRSLVTRIGLVQFNHADPTSGEVTKALNTLRVPASLGLVLGGLGIAGDLNTLVRPEDKGAAGWVDRGMAGANGLATGNDMIEGAKRFLGKLGPEGEAAGEAGEAAGEAAGDAAAGGLLDAGVGLGAEAAELGAADAAFAAVPGVGEAVMLGTGAYLAGDFLYHKWPSFHHFIDHGAHTAVDIANAQQAALKGAYHVGGDALKGGYQAAGDLGRGAVSTAGDLMRGNFSQAGSDLSSAGSHAASDASAAARHVVSDAGHAASQVGGALKSAGHDAAGVGKDVLDMYKDMDKKHLIPAADAARGISKGISAVKSWF